VRPVFLKQKERTVSDEIKRVIVKHCSPVLLGCKPAALFTLGSEKVFAALCTLLQPRFELMVMRKSRNGLLVLMFEKERLAETMSHKDIHAFLAGMGYPCAAPLFVLLKFLNRQFMHSDFPHEVGIFLGYPVEDVLGFVQHRGQHYKFLGYWKVYGDVEQAKKHFRQYDACRKCFNFFLSDRYVPLPNQLQARCAFLDGTKHP
jgi:hypothetical protein